MTTIVKATTKGQITLPVAWRRAKGAERYVVEDKGDKLEIRPLHLDRLNTGAYDTVFDALRDNAGKGIKAKDLARLLKKK